MWTDGPKRMEVFGTISPIGSSRGRVAAVDEGRERRLRKRYEEIEGV